jgi:hypothetical protein
MGVAPKLTLPRREDVVAYRRDHPAMTLAEIGARFGITGGYVSNLCQRDLRRREPDIGPPRPKASPNMMPGLTLSLLMGGRTPRAKLQPA